MDIDVIVDGGLIDLACEIVDGLFGPLVEQREIVRAPVGSDMYDVLVLVGLFPSKGEARKNWTRTGKTIPAGFTDFGKVGRMKHRLAVWNPGRRKLAAYHRLKDRGGLDAPRKPDPPDNLIVFRNKDGTVAREVRWEGNVDARVVMGILQKRVDLPKDFDGTFEVRPAE